MKRPLLALSLGDPAGIGPEILMRLLGEGDLPARLLVLGDPAALERARDFLARAESTAAGCAGEIAAADIPLPPQVRAPAEAAASDHPVCLWAPHGSLDPLPAPGRIDEAGGAASHQWVLEGARLAATGVVDGLVTGPIHKEAWRRAGVSHPGHTEVLREEAGVDHVLMVLAGGRLRTALATIHVPLHEVPGLLTTEGLLADLVLLDRELPRVFSLEVSRPRIAVAGLNPHAGEGGLFGREEGVVIEPAVAAARGHGIDAHGPLPADACIPAAAAGCWDAVLAMYHDQALPAVKSIAWRQGINVTLGLPFLRTSVDHGTAFDLAGRGFAVASSLREAVRLAAASARRMRTSTKANDEGGLNTTGAPSDLVS